MKRIVGAFAAIGFLVLSLYFSVPVSAIDSSVGVTYQSHVQNIGWQAAVTDGAIAGTVGHSQRMEAFTLQLTNAPSGAGIKYDSYIANTGWQNSVMDGAQSGTVNRALALEAIRITLVNLPGYSVEYQVHLSLLGWQSWVSNGDISGIVGGNMKIEAIRIRLVKVSDNSNVSVQYEGQVENVGWQSTVSNAMLAGTTGRGLRLEALRIRLIYAPLGGSISYEAHVQNIGWMAPSLDGQTAGTVGPGLRLEALKISLINMPGYSVQYRAHVSNIGWQPWVSDGAIAGTVNRALRIEAIEIRIVSSPIAMILPTSVTLNKATDRIDVGNSEMLIATVLPADTSVKNVLWLSSDPAVATVSAEGLVTAVSNGSTTVTATTIWGNVSASCEVTVSSLVDLATEAVVAYETAPITTLVQIAAAEELKATADTAVALVVDPTIRSALELRISARAVIIAQAKATLQLAEAIAAINEAPDASAMSLAITTYAPILGLNLTTYNTLLDIGKLNVQNALLPMPYTTSVQIKSVFDSSVVQQVALQAVNTATLSTMNSVITTYSSALVINSAILADYNLLTTDGKNKVHLALTDKAFTTISAVNTAFGNIVSVQIMNEITADSEMKAAIIRYQTILGLSLTNYNTLTTAFKTNVHSTLIAATMSTTGEVKTVFDNAVAQAKLDYAVYVINIQVFNYMDRDIRAYAVTLGLDLTDYNLLINKTPLLTAMVAEPFTTVAHVKEYFDALVTYQKYLESLPMLEAFNSADNAATMANVIEIYSTVFNPADYNTYYNYLGTPAKIIIQTAMLTPVYKNEKDIRMAFILGIMNNQYINYGKQVYYNNYILLGLSTNSTSNEFGLLSSVERTAITNAIFANRPIVDQAHMLLNVFNNVTTPEYIGTLINLDGAVFGLDLTKYQTLVDKTPMYNSLMGQGFTTPAELKAAFDAEMAILSTVSATLETPKEFNLDLPLNVFSQVTLNSATDITGIQEVYNAYTLVATEDYSFDPQTGILIITQNCLSRLSSVPGDTLLFNVSFNVGEDAQLVVNVTGTTIISAYVNGPKEFNVVNPSSVITTIDMNSATQITGINNNGVPLIDGIDYLFDPLTSTLTISQTYLESIGANAGDSMFLTVTFDVGYDSGLGINFINNDITAAGSATALSNTNIITYTLSYGTFDAVTAVDPNNWVLSGNVAAELGNITGIVLTNGDTTATISISGTIVQYTVDYIIEPLQAAFPIGVISSSYTYILVIDPYAAGTATAATSSQTITYRMTVGSLDPLEAVVTANWVLGGTDAAELGEISSAVLSEGDTVVTFTITGTVGSNLKIYTIEPLQQVFTNAGYTAPVLPETIVVTP